jgi:D-alanyl-D-alanine carboxypeptidase
MPEPYAHGYAASAPAAPLRDVTQSNPDVAWSAGAMISTMHDLRVWCNTLLAGTLLPPELQAERLRITYAATEPLALGYGLGIMEMGGVIGHNGGILGYGSWMVQDPASGTTMVMVANEGSTEGGDGSSLIFLRVAALLFPDRGFSSLLDMMATPAPSGS